MKNQDIGANRDALAYARATAPTLDTLTQTMIQRTPQATIPKRVAKLTSLLQALTTKKDAEDM